MVHGEATRIGTMLAVGRDGVRGVSATGLCSCEDKYKSLSRMGGFDDDATVVSHSGKNNQDPNGTFRSVWPMTFNRFRFSF